MLRNPAILRIGYYSDHCSGQLATAMFACYKKRSQNFNFLADLLKLNASGVRMLNFSMAMPRETDYNNVQHLDNLTAFGALALDQVDFYFTNRLTMSAERHKYINFAGSITQSTFCFWTHKNHVDEAYSLMLEPMRSNFRFLIIGIIFVILSLYLVGCFRPLQKLSDFAGAILLSVAVSLYNAILRSDTIIPESSHENFRTAGDLAELIKNHKYTMVRLNVTSNQFDFLNTSNNTGFIQLRESLKHNPPKILSGRSSKTLCEWVGLHHGYVFMESSTEVVQICKEFYFELRSVCTQEAPPTFAAYAVNKRASIGERLNRLADFTAAFHAKAWRDAGIHMAELAAKSDQGSKFRIGSNNNEFWHLIVLFFGLVLLSSSALCAERYISRKYDDMNWYTIPKLKKRKIVSFNPKAKVLTIDAMCVQVTDNRDSAF